MDKDEYCSLGLPGPRLTTQAGLEGWSRLRPGLLGQEILHTLDAAFSPRRASTAAESALALESGWSSADLYPVLDLRALVAAGLVVAGDRRGFCLDWSSSDGRVLWVLGACDMRDPEAARCLFQVTQDRNRWRQEIEIHHGARLGGFVCPVTGKPTNVLFLRGRRFASKSGQRLVGRSRVMSRSEVISQRRMGLGRSPSIP